MDGGTPEIPAGAAGWIAGAGVALAWIIKTVGLNAFLPKKEEAAQMASSNHELLTAIHGLTAVIREGNKEVCRRLDDLKTSVGELKDQTEEVKKAVDAQMVPLAIIQTILQSNAGAAGPRRN